MEALVAVGLVGNLVQFLDFGAKLVTQSLRLYRSGQDVLVENLDLDITTKHLSLLSERIAKGAEQDDDEVLQRLCISCQSVAFELLLVLGRLKSKKNDGRKWTTLARAMKSVWHQDEITNLAHRLAGFRAELNLHVSLELRSDILALQQSQPEILDKVDDMARAIIGSMDEQKDVYQAALATRFQELKDLQFQLLGQFKSESTANHGMMKDLDSKLSNILADRDEPAGLSMEKVMLENLMKDLTGKLQSPTTEISVSREQLRSWLKPISTEDKWQAARNWRVPETSNWILQRDSFKAWASATSTQDHMKFFWLHGGPGFGKTMLCASILEHLKENHPSGVAYFFCVSDDEARRQPSTILRSWIAQIVEQNDTAHQIVSDAYVKKTPGSGDYLLAPDDVWELLRLICKAIPNIFLVVDGFDECIKINKNSKFYANEAELFLEQLVDSAASTPCHLLLVSREDHDVRYQFRRFAELFPHAHFEHEITYADTESVMLSFANRAFNKRLRRQDAAVKSELVTIATERSRGMFLWVQLLVNRLQPDRPAKELRKIVSEAPVEINVAYENDIKRIMSLGDERERAVSILRWVFFAQRPLTVRELTEALVIDLDDHREAYPIDSLPDSWLEEDVNDRIRRLGGALIELRAGDGDQSAQSQTIHFVHFSVREFLSAIGEVYHSSPESLFFRDTNRESCFLARLCLRYVTYKEVTKEFPKTEEDLNSKTKQYGFLKYASAFWFAHARNNQSWSDQLCDGIKSFFSTHRQAFVVWCRIIEAEGLGNDPSVSAPTVQSDSSDPIYYASLLGFASIISFLLERGADCNAKGPFFGHALSAASARGHGESVKLLLGKGANPNAVDSLNRTALGWAARFNWHEIVRLLIDQSADLDVAEDNNYTPLHRAAASGHIETARLLVEKGANLELENDSNWTALHLATRYGHSQVFHLLLAHGAKINRRTDYKWTELHFAIFNSHIELARELIKRGAVIDTLDEAGFTPLNRGAGNATPEDLKLLLEHGADVNKKSNDGWTPMYLAAEYGRLDNVKLLFEHGAKPDTPGNGNWTAIHVAAAYGRTTIVQYLMKTAGVDVNLKKADSWTALHLAVHNNHLETVEFLLDNRADLEAKNADGQSAFYLAAAKGDLSVINLLYDRDANINVTSNYERTPLYHASMSGQIEAVKFLVSKRVPIETANKDGWQPLHTAAQGGHLEIVRYLLEHGADVNATETEGWTPLHCAAQAGRKETAEVLLKHGAMLEAKVSYGGTAVYMAASNGHSDLIELLIQYGAQINYFTTEGWTPLQQGAQNGHFQVVETLLKHGADANARYEGRTTALYWSAYKGKLDIVKLLREHGATMLLHEQDGWSPLHGAAEAGHTDVIVYFLMEKMASVDQRTKSGRTPLYLAASNGHLQAIQCLIAHKADINALGNSDWVPLHIAACNGHLEMIKFLIENGADLSACDVDGWDTLYVAANSGHLEIVRYLIVEQHQQVDRMTKDGRTCLFGAANQGKLEVAKFLIEEMKLEVNLVSKSGWTPLMLASSSGHLDMVVFLIDHKAVVGIEKEDDGWSDVQLATEYKHSDIVKTLVEHGANINTASRGGWTLLHRAAHNNDLNLVTWLLANGADVFVREKTGWQPLHMAAQADSVEIMKALIHGMGNKLDDQEDDGWTAFYVAVVYKRAQAAKFLLGTECDINIADHKGLTPLYVAIQHSWFDFASSLLRKNDAAKDITGPEGFAPLHLALRYGGYDLARALIADYNADINAKTSEGRSPLILAAEFGQTDLVQLLLERGAIIETGPYSPAYYSALRGHIETLTFFLDRNPPTDINERSEDGQSFVYAAAAAGDVNMIKFLFSRHADLNIKTTEGWAALHTAAEGGHVEVVRFLVENGADIDNAPSSPAYVAASHGMAEVVKTLLQYQLQHKDRLEPEDEEALLCAAASKGNLELVQFLLGRGIKSKAGETGESSPLSSACENNHLEVVRLLARNGWSIHEPNNREKFTPLHTASSTGSLDLIKCLIEEFGADVECETKRGWRPLHLAAYYGHLEVVKYLTNVAGAVVTSRLFYGFSLLHVASFNKKPETLKYVLTFRYHSLASPSLMFDSGQHEDCDNQDHFSNTALHLAVTMQDLESVKILLEAGANPCIPDGLGITPFDMVMENPDIVAHFTPYVKDDFQNQKAKGGLSSKQIQRQTLQKLVQSLLQTGKRSQSPGFEELGGCLKLFGDYEATWRCVQACIERVTEDGQAVYESWCAHCEVEVLIGTRFDCKTCPEITLCDKCMPQHDKTLRHWYCRGHEFHKLTTPPGIEQRFKSHDPDAISDELRQFLRELLVKYGDGDDDTKACQIVVGSGAKDQL